MAAECARVLQGGMERVTFVVDRKPTRSGRVRLTPKSGPWGEVACVNADGATVAWFKALDVLAWMGANGMVKITVVPKAPGVPPAAVRKVPEHA
jgi:hypothetical protein